MLVGQDSALKTTNNKNSYPTIACIFVFIKLENLYRIHPFYFSGVIKMEIWV